MNESRTSRPYSRAEQAADETIHVIGVLAALLAVPVMVTLAAVWRDDGAVIAAVAVYGVTLLAMLGFSASYNVAYLRARSTSLIEMLRRLDHAAIYVKIAGTYTPYAVIAGGPVGRWLLIGVWSGAVIGLLGKLIAPHKWERASLVLYLALGWAFVFAAGPVSASITQATLVLIIVGGCLYTTGVIFHVWTRLPFQNAIWHFFVLAATCVFYSAMTVEIALGQ
jgi:hemolysin III